MRLTLPLCCTDSRCHPVSFGFRTCRECPTLIRKVMYDFMICLVLFVPICPCVASVRERFGSHFDRCKDDQGLHALKEAPCRAVNEDPL